MTCEYPNLKATLPAYFSQDYSLDFNDAKQAGAMILKDYLKGDRIEKLIMEIKKALESNENLGEDFFTRLGVDSVPCVTDSEGREFFKYMISSYENMIKNA